MTMIGLRYDLRAPSFGPVTHAELYAACLDQSAWADRLGLDFVVLSEHHGVEDGYLPAPVTLAAAIAGRTKTIRISIAAVLVPLHDPVRLAEQLAVLDLASGSRVSLIAGLGYRQEEFAMADGGFVHLPSGPGFVHVSDDPERDWARIAPHALYDAQTYAAWQTPGQRSAVHVEARNVEELRRSGVYRVVTPDECVALAKETGQVLLHPLMGGLPPALGWEGLERFAAKVLPRLRGA